MAKLTLKKDIFTRALAASQLDDSERSLLETISANSSNSKSSVSANVREFPRPFLHALLDDSRLTANQRAVISLQIFGMAKADVDCQKIYQTKVSSPIEFGSTFALLGGRAANCEVFLNGRWYPVTMGVNFLKGHKNEINSVAIHAGLRMCETAFGIHHFVYSDLFIDDAGAPRERTVLEILQYFQLRPIQTNSADFNLKLVRAERLGRETGSQMLVTGPALADSESYFGTKFISRSLGTTESPRKVIVEPELEVSEDRRAHYSHYGNEDVQSKLPFIRIFSLDTKSYMYVDVDDVIAYEFDENAMSRLHLPNGMLSVLGKVFSTPVDRLFGDLIAGKHGGIVVLAAGNPGVGKTLTAEVYAEHTERPLYVLELGELGTNASEVETNLQKVFSRVSRWNAVLQFDECEIFLSERGTDLERSAIVGIFLRLLDYYQGILFLTTNRCDVLDHAVLSRVMLKLEYPDLDMAARQTIWQSMFEAAGLELVDGSIEELAKIEMNGRQIRNLTRLTKILYPEGLVSFAEMTAVLGYGSMTPRPSHDQNDKVGQLMGNSIGSSHQYFSAGAIPREFSFQQSSGNQTG